MNQAGQACVLLFSGGRDSTLAAIRLSFSFQRLTLVTVTSGHLVGLEAVHRRLRELKFHLSANTRWVNVQQPAALPSDQFFRAPTCLPCHRSYTAIGTMIAESFHADSLAFGYTRYQSDWLEQTPHATECLTRVLASRRINFLLPVYDIASKSEAIAELGTYGLSTGALEQKCLQQQFNVAIDPTQVQEEIAAFEQALINALGELSRLKLETLNDTTLGEISSLE